MRRASARKVAMLAGLVSMIDPGGASRRLGGMISCGTGLPITSLNSRSASTCSSAS
jgi:hypothetical protein